MRPVSDFLAPGLKKGIVYHWRARVAQLDRVTASEAAGCGFNSRLAHHIFCLIIKRLLLASIISKLLQRPESDLVFDGIMEERALLDGLENPLRGQHGRRALDKAGVLQYPGQMVNAAAIEMGTDHRREALALSQEKFQTARFAGSKLLLPFRLALSKIMQTYLVSHNEKNVC